MCSCDEQDCAATIPCNSTVFSKASLAGLKKRAQKSRGVGGGRTGGALPWHDVRECEPSISSWGCSLASVSAEKRRRSFPSFPFLSLPFLPFPFLAFPYFLPSFKQHTVMWCTSILRPTKTHASTLTKNTRKRNWEPALLTQELVASSDVRMPHGRHTLSPQRSLVTHSQRLKLQTTMA